MCLAGVPIAMPHGSCCKLQSAVTWQRHTSHQKERVKVGNRHISNSTDPGLFMTMHTLITVLQSGAGALLGLEHLHDLSQSCSPCDWPKASTTSTGSTSKGVEQYSENMVHIVLSTVLALVRSVAVHSMNTSFVSSVICITQIIKLKHLCQGVTYLQ